MNEIGDILEATDRSINAGRHFIIYYDSYDGVNFIGAMVTHNVCNKNLIMDRSHFEEIDINGEKYKFQFDETYLVIAKLIKFNNWGPFTKVGKLTNSGIEFVKVNIDPLSEETWDHYLIRTNLNL